MPSWANDDTDVTMHKTYMQSCVYASLPPCVVEHDLPGHPSFRILTTITQAVFDIHHRPTPALQTFNFVEHTRGTHDI